MREVTSEVLCYKVENLCGLLGVSRPVAYKLAQRTDFPTIRLGRRVLIPKSGLEKWLEQQSDVNVLKEVR